MHMAATHPSSDLPDLACVKVADYLPEARAQLGEPVCNCGKSSLFEFPELQEFTTVPTTALKQQGSPSADEKGLRLEDCSMI